MIHGVLNRSNIFSKKKKLPSNYFNCTRLRPFTKKKADALAIMCPTNTFCNCRTNIKGVKLFAQAHVLILWNGVRNLNDSRIMSTTIQVRVHTTNCVIGNSSIKLILASERRPSVMIDKWWVKNEYKTYHAKLQHGQTWRLFHGEYVPRV